MVSFFYHHDSNFGILDALLLCPQVPCLAQTRDNPAIQGFQFHIWPAAHYQKK